MKSDQCGLEQITFQSIKKNILEFSLGKKSDFGKRESQMRALKTFSSGLWQPSLLDELFLANHSPSPGQFFCH